MIYQSEPFKHLPANVREAMNAYDDDAASGKLAREIGPTNRDDTDPGHWVGRFMSAHLPAQEFTAKPTHQPTGEEVIASTSEAFTTIRPDGQETFA